MSSTPTSIPPTPPDSQRPGGAAERLVWDALMGTLGSGWWVLHGLQILGEGAAQRELDFVVLHRQHGLLVIECKGAGLRRGRDGRWSRVRPDGGYEPARDPVEQVMTATQELARALRERWREVSGDGRLPVVFGHALITPRANRDGPLPLDLRSELCWTADDLPRLGDRVRRALSFWCQAAPVLPVTPDAAAFKRFRRTCLQPVLQLTPGLRARLAAQDAALVRLAADQQALLSGLLVNPRLQVSGPAGSGKSVLAVAAAKRLAERGKRVLLVCFNRALGDHLREAGQRFLAERGLPDAQLVVRSFHLLCHEACERRGAAWEVPADRDVARLFWRDEAPRHLLEAVAEGCVAPFDAIIVDEAQDFLPDWGALLRMTLVNPASDHLWLFGDDAQDLWGRGGFEASTVPRFRLSRSHRSTAALTRYCAGLLGLDAHPSRLAPEGEPPVQHGPVGPTKRLRQVAQVVRQLTEGQGVSAERIVLLTPRRKENSSLAEVAELAGLAICDELDDREGRLLHSTISRFKGLESDVVLLLDIAEDTPPGLVYVGASRARLLLHVWAA